MKNIKSKLISACEHVISYTQGRNAYRVIAIVFVVMAGVLVLGSLAHAIDIPIIGDLFGALQKFIIWVLMSVLKFIVNLLYTVIDLLISFLGYNNFTRETPVIQGWIYVRNIANMFFSIMMLIIVYGTIFGKGPNYQTLPKLLLMAILVNFSKSITGFMIDISQVPTLTFLIAFKASATANFTQGLAIDKYVSLSGSWLADNPQGIDFSNIFVSLLLGLIIAGFALMIVSIMTIMTLIRIIVFWIMIVLSPIAFVGRGIDLIKSQTWDMWMGEMKKWLIYGPVMSFFLWLSMMMMVNPDATTSSFSKPSASSSVWAGEIGNFDYFIRVVLTLGMLYGALYAAQKLGGSVGGALAGKVKKFGMTTLKVGGAAVTVGAIGAALKGTSLGLAGVSGFLRKSKGGETAANVFGKMSRITRATGSVGTGLVTQGGRKELMTTAKTFTKGKWSDIKHAAQIKYDEATLGKGMSYVKPKSADEKMSIERLRMETLKAQGFNVRDLSKDKKWIDETLKEQKDLEKKGEKLSGPKRKELARVQARALDNLSKDTWDDFHETYGIDSMIAAYEEKNKIKFDRDENGRIDKNKENFRAAMAETILPEMFSKYKIDAGRQGEVLGVFDNVVKDPLIKKIGGVIKSDISVQKAISSADDFRRSANIEFGEGASDALKTEGDFKDAGIKTGKSKGNEAADKFARQMINIETSNGAYDSYAQNALSKERELMKNIFGENITVFSKRADVVNKVQNMIKDGKSDEDIKKMMLEDHQIDLKDSGLTNLKSFLKTNHVLNEDGFKDLYKKQSEMKKQFYDKETVNMIGKLDILEKGNRSNIENQIEDLENQKTSKERTVEEMRRNGTKFSRDGKSINELKKLIDSDSILINQLKEKTLTKDFESGTIENMNRKSIGELSVEKNDQDFVIKDDFRVMPPGLVKLFFEDDIEAGSAGKVLSVDDVNKLIQKLQEKQKELNTKLVEGSSKTTTTDQDSFIKEAFDKYNVALSDSATTMENLDSVLKQIKYKEEILRQQLAVLSKAKNEATTSNTVVSIGDTKKVPGAYDFAIDKIKSCLRSNAVTGKDSVANDKINNISASMVSNINEFIKEFNAISKNSLAGMSDDQVAKLLYSIKTGTHDLSKFDKGTGHKKLLEKINEALAKSKATLIEEENIKKLLKS